MCNKTKKTISVKTFFVFYFFLFFHTTLSGIFSNYQLRFVVQYADFSNWKLFEYFFSKWIISDQKCQISRAKLFWNLYWTFFVTFLRLWDLFGNFFQFFSFFPSSMTSIGNPRDWSFWTKSAEFPGQMAPILLKLPQRVKPTIWRLILSL